MIRYLLLTIAVFLADLLAVALVALAILLNGNS